jgi:fluoride exporter
MWSKPFDSWCTMNNAIFIFLGCGLGGLMRYWVSLASHFYLGRAFPYGTLAVNVTGSFVMGLLFVVLIDRFHEIAAPLRAFLLIGFLGGYTTFSSFAIETVNLIESGAWQKGLLNILLSVSLTVTAAALGIMLGRQV